MQQAFPLPDPSRVDPDALAPGLNGRPPGWRNPQPREPYHLLVIGAGPAGLVAARAAAALGARVALVEGHLLGGLALNYGAVPSQALIRTSRLYAETLHNRSWPLALISSSAGHVLSEATRSTCTVCAYASRRR